MGPTVAFTPTSAAIASLAPACATFSAVIAAASPCRVWTSEEAVYVALPNVNDPFGVCFCVPAMTACTSAKASALDGFIVDVVMVFSSFLEGGHRRDAEPDGAFMPRPESLPFHSPPWTIPARLQIPDGNGGNRPRGGRFRPSARKGVGGLERAKAEIERPKLGRCSP